MRRSIHSRRIISIALAALGCLAGLSLPAGAITTTAMGIIWDASHNTPCAGAWVWVRDQSNSVYANSQGLYLIENFDMPLGFSNTNQGATRTGFADLYKSTSIQPGLVNTINAFMRIGSLVSGRVTSHETGSPALAGATVTAETTVIYKLLTQTDGSYSVRLSPGNWRFYAEENGYSDSLTTQLTLTDGVDVPNYNFQLFIGGTITGTVYYGDTTATADGIWIQCHPSDSTDPNLFAQTGSDGTYTLQHVYPAPAYLITDAPAQWRGVVRDFVPVVDENTTAGIDFRLLAAGDISGTITAYTGAPVSGVKVSLTMMYSTGDEVGSMNTDAQGFYTIPDLPEGNYDIFVKPPQGTNLQSLRVGNEQIRQNVPVSRNFTLQPGGKISGIVRGPDGNIIANSKIAIFLESMYPFTPLFDGYTDAGGGYTFDGLTPYQNYTVAVEPTNVNTYTASAAERGLTVEEQMTRVLDFDLDIGGGLQGTVLDESSQPYSGYLLAFFINDQKTFGRLSINGAIDFIGLPEGNYSLLFLPLPTTSVPAQTRSFVTRIDSGQVNALDFSESAGETCSGYVYYLETGGNTRPASNIPVQIKSAMDPTAAFGIGLIGHGSTDGGGRFEFTGLSRLGYDLEALPPITDANGFACVNSRVDLTNGSVSRYLYLSQNGQKVSGLMRDQGGSRLINGLVFFWNDSGFRAYTQTDHWGNYAIMLAPGTYSVQGVYESMTGLNYAMEPQGGVQVLAGQNLQRELIISSGGSVSGRIADQVGNPIGLAKVWVYTADNLLPYRYGFTDQAGKYTIRGLHSAPYSIGVECAGYSVGSGGFNATLGEETEQVNLVLVEQTSIAGRIIAKNGKPLYPSTASVLAMSSDQVLLQTTANPDGEFILSPITGGPYRVKAAATGMKAQVITGIYPGERADFTLEPLISRDEAISYPNPCRGKQIKFLYWLDEDATVLIRVYNQTAALVWDWEGQGQGQKYNQHEWDVSGVAPGVYLFKVTARDRQGSMKSFPAGKLTVIK
ncbi:MAG: carboxypeptidase regulatory-like domain-containing protein [candidate division FCPU426 bacterium]